MNNVAQLAERADIDSHQSDDDDDIDSEFDRGRAMIRIAVYQPDIAANTGATGEAVGLLEQAMEEGLGLSGDYDLLHRDPFLRPLRGHPAFENYLHQGR